MVDMHAWPEAIDHLGRVLPGRTARARGTWNRLATCMAAPNPAEPWRTPLSATCRTPGRPDA